MTNEDNTYRAVVILFGYVYSIRFYLKALSSPHSLYIIHYSRHEKVHYGKFSSSALFIVCIHLIKTSPFCYLENGKMLSMNFLSESYFMPNNAKTVFWYTNSEDLNFGTYFAFAGIWI